MPRESPDDIEPIVPIMPSEPTTLPLPDGGRHTPSPPTRTDYAIDYERDTEEVLPLVPDLR
jgi:hypothetical protein